jgi:glycosyltransferase involved in cell wall biosynthesis
VVRLDAKDARAHGETLMGQPVVGIVMRTKNRRVLLKRAIESVLSQSYQSWVLIVVNDGGDMDQVEALVERYAGEARGRIRILHNPRSLGMEGASKVGLEVLDTDLMIVHDDDDRWAPEFLTVAVRELARIRISYPSVQGVTTLVNLVMEQVHGNVIHIDSIEPFNSWVPHGLLSLDRMLSGNFIPPIAFLFSRHAFDELGGIYEPVPYLGDWDFLIRFLLKYDVYVIPQYLAFYHWRSRSESGVLGNSVTGDVDRHRFVRQLLLNKWLREDLSGGRFGAGAYANLRGHIETLANSGEEVQRLLKALPAPVHVVSSAGETETPEVAPPSGGEDSNEEPVDSPTVPLDEPVLVESNGTARNGRSHVLRRFARRIYEGYVGRRTQSPDS